jgi:hypothetical protein
MKHIKKKIVKTLCSKWNLCNEGLDVISVIVAIGRTHKLPKCMEGETIQTQGATKRLLQRLHLH